jgi:nitrate/nitrite-specific signal transduction histidine kinase
MKVTRVMASIALLPLLMLLILIMFLLFQFTEIRSHARHARAADMILQKSNELAYLTDTYLLNQQPVLWERIFAKLAQASALAKGEKSASGSEFASIPRKLELDYGQMGKLLQRYNDNSVAGNSELHRRLQAVLERSIVVKSRDIVSTAQRLSQEKGTQLAKAGKDTTTGAVAALLLLSVAVPAATIPMTRRLSRSLTRLREGISKSSPKSLTTVEDQGDFEEFSAIATAYNALTAALHGSFEELEQKSDQLQKLNATLNAKVLERTEELSKANRLLEQMRKHSDSMSRGARLEAAKHHEEERRLQLLMEYTQRILRHSTLSGLLKETTDAAQDVLDARYAVVGHGDFHQEISAAKAGRLACPLQGKFRIDRGGVYLDILRKGEPVRLTQQDLERHPAWWGLPESHAKLRGLLAVPLKNERNVPFAVLMATDRADGADFTEQDEKLLVYLASVAAVAMTLISRKNLPVQ